MVFLSKYLGRADVHITDEIPLSFSVAASSALRIGLASSPLSALPIGTRAYRTGSRSSPYTHDSTLTCQAAVPQLLFQLLASVPSCRVVVKETADLGVGLQYAFRFRKIGNGVQYDIVLCVQSRVLRIVFYSDGKE